MKARTCDTTARFNLLHLEAPTMSLPMFMRLTSVASDRIFKFSGAPLPG
jgi:hypothetical protein